MRLRIERHFVCLMLCSSLATALSANAQDKVVRKQNPDNRDYQAKLALFQTRGKEALAAETSLEKEDRCRNAVTTLDIGECESRLLESTKGNYVAYVRAIGALLRLSDSVDFKDQTPPPDSGAAFDTAESLWIKYRDSQCESGGNLYWGGTMRPGAILGCRVMLTQHHIHDLQEIYADLWS